MSETNVQDQSGPPPAVTTQAPPASAETQTTETSGADPAAKTDATENDASAGEAAPKPKKPGGGFQRRIDELTRDKHELQRNLDAALEAMRARSGPQRSAQADNGDDQGPPTQDKFASYDDYMAALTDYRVERKLAARQQVEAREAEERSRREAGTALQTRLREAAAKAAEVYPDFEEVIADADVMVTPAMARSLSLSDKAEHVMYWLAKNEAEARRISELQSAEAQARALALIEAKLTTKPRSAVSAAPEPPQTVAGRKTGNPDPSKMNQEEYRKWREAGGGSS